MYTKFSKPLNDILKIKSSFFKENQKLLKENEKLLKFYKLQPIRKLCKNCNYKLQKKNDFVSHDIGYKICKRCSQGPMNPISEKLELKFCHEKLKVALAAMKLLIFGKPKQKLNKEHYSMEVYNNAQINRVVEFHFAYRRRKL